MTDQTFTIYNETFTVGEKWWFKNSTFDCRVEVIGPMKGHGYLAARLPDGFIIAAWIEYLTPIPEPTIEVPVSVAKRIVRFGNSSSVPMSWDDAADTITSLLTKAGH